MPILGVTASGFRTSVFTWIAGALSYGNHPQVAFGNSLFATVGYGSSVADYSTDGINWTSSTLPSSGSWSGIMYGSSGFVSTINGTAVAISTDAVTWTSSTVTDSAAWQANIYEFGLYMCFANNNNPAIKTSPTGVTWTTRTAPSPGHGRFYNSCSSGSLVFTCAYGPTSVGMTSPDGTTWTSRSLPTSEDYFGTAFGNGKFLVVPYSQAYAYTSADASTWTSRTLPFTNAAECAHHAGSGSTALFIIVNNSGLTCATSPDGITWTSRASAINNLRGMASGLGKVVGVAGNGTSQYAIWS